MPDDAFTIYGTPDGYVAVTNPVRRAILEELEKGERELPDLVEVTGRSKSSLSSNHVPKLREKGVVEERPHPTDGRRKIYVLMGERLGSSSVPVDQLRDAVKDYVTTAPLAARLTIAEALDAVGGGATPWERGEELGGTCARFIEVQGAERPLVVLSSFLEREGLAETLRIDLEHSRLALAPRGGMDPGEAPEVLGGFAQSLLRHGGIGGVAVTAHRREGEVLLDVDLPG